MEEKRLEFVVEEAGCLIWLAPMSLGGLTLEEFGRVWTENSDGTTVADLVARGAMMPMGLYQDDGYLVCFVLGDLSDQEEREWTARVRWKLDGPCGQVLVSGPISDDLEDELSGIEPAEDGGSYWTGCHVEVSPGEYHVEVYGYPPGDLSGGWGRIAKSDLFGTSPGIEPEDPPTSSASPAQTRRPGLVEGGYDDTPYVDFVVRLSPLTHDPPLPDLEADGCIEWEFRKPDLCPTGLRSNLPPNRTVGDTRVPARHPPRLLPHLVLGVTISSMGELIVTT